MPLSAGTRLGPYEIGSPLGAGGMGEVYRARDTRLDRSVAIKVLPPALASDPQFRERFDREARVISQLDHPNICPLYDVGQEEGTAYLVMPHLDGETLADRLARGSLAVDEALRIGAEIADALARAHRAGIIHRDLKPGNIMLTRGGAKLLDFGLAKPSSAAGAAGVGPSAATVASPLTAQGTLLGTFQYMAPEQIEGTEADVRSDVWAFGCVLYEMLAGTRPFTGKSPASLLAGIMHAQPPPLHERRPDLPPAIAHLASRCLAKDPDDRWQSMADIGHQLRWVMTAPMAPVVPRRARVRGWIYAAALMSVGAAAIAIVVWMPVSRTPSVPAAPLKLAVPPAAGLTLTPFGSFGNPHFALSPDGSKLAFVASAPRRPPSLWIRHLDSRATQEIPGSDDASAPFWSSDSRAIGFFAVGRLRTIALNGERPTALTPVMVDAAGAAWHGDVILIGRGASSLLRVPAGGGRPIEASVASPNGGGHRWPQFLPDGRRFIYTESRGPVMLGSLDSTSATPLIDSAGATGVFDPAGFLLLVPPRSDRLVARLFDGRSLVTAAAGRETLEQVNYAAGSGYPPVSVSTNGLLAYWDGTTLATELGWYDRRGRPLPTLPVPPNTRSIAVSPADDRQIAFVQGGGRADMEAVSSIWLMNPAGEPSRFSYTDQSAARPIWSADGRHIYFTASDGQTLLLLRGNSGGTEKEEVLATIPPTGLLTTGMAGSYWATDWSNDGRTALVSLTRPGTGRDVIAVSTATGAQTPLFARDASEIQATFSPDDRWIAYASNETGRWEVFVEPFPASGPRAQVSVEGGSQPVWRRDGRELFFLAPGGKMMSVSVSPGPTFVRGSPQALFDTPMRPTYAPYPVNYDVTSDGQRFLIVGVRPDTAPTISLVVNWSAATKR
jgi:serine/threonine protein kinase